MGLFDVIRYNSDGKNDWVLYKYPENSIPTGSLLVVQEGQSAVFVLNGAVADIFGPGKHELTTDNLPVLNKLVNIPFGGKSPFPAEIYFVNTVARLAFSWGTQGPIQLTEATGERLLVRAFGQIGIRVADEATLFMDAIGSLEKAGVVSVDRMKEFFRGMLLADVKKGISQLFSEGGRLAFEDPDRMQDLSDCIIGLMAPEMEQYGFQIVDFQIQNLNVEQEFSPQGRRICQQCGKKMQNDFIFCPYCGKKLATIKEIV